VIKRLVALCACALLAACATTTSTRTAAPSAMSAPAKGTKVLVVQPDVQLSMLTAVGLQEPRADWSQQARDNLRAAVEGQIKTRSYKVELLDPQESMAGRAGQLIRLHDAVGQSIIAFNYGAIDLPTKKGAFDWTLGDGVRTLGESHAANYALFVTARGSYSSSARKAVMVGAALLGVGLPLGGQQAFASLVDLRTGQVVWFNVARAGAADDMRSPEGAATLAASLMTGAPL
jgi:hypothetical protein